MKSGKPITRAHIQPDPTRRLVAVTLSGPVGGDDLQRTFLEMIEHPAFERGWNSLWDLRDASLGDISSDALRKVVAFVDGHRERRGKGKVAIVAVSDVNFGVSRIYEVLAGDLETPVRVFRSLAEAERWFATPS